MIVKNRLLNFKDKIIYQDNEWFNFSLDSVLLANFVNLKVNDKRIIDLATGNAPIPMLLTYKTTAKIYGMDIQESVLSLGVKSIYENNMNNQIELICDDIKNIHNYFNYEYFDIITCNPPYFEYSSSSNTNRNEIKTIARHEKLIKLEEIISISSKMLNNKGNLLMVHRTSRMIEIIELFKKYHLEPKRIQLIYPHLDSESNLFLIEGKKNGNKGLKILPPLYVHNKDGSYRDEIKIMFGE